METRLTVKLWRYLFEETRHSQVDTPEQFQAAMEKQHKRRREEKETLQPKETPSYWRMVLYDYSKATEDPDNAFCRKRLVFRGLSHTYCLEAEPGGLEARGRRACK